MLALAAVGFLFTPLISAPLNRQDLFGANLSHLAEDLLTTLAGYQLAAAAIATWCNRLIYWRAATATLAAGQIIAYLLSEEYHTPAPEFALHDTGSLALDGLTLTAIATAFVLLLVSALLAAHAADYRALSMVAMYLVGVLGTSFAVLVAALMIMDPSRVHHNYRDIAAGWAIPTLIVFAIAGMPGLVKAWAVRDDPT